MGEEHFRQQNNWQIQLEPCHLFDTSSTRPITMTLPNIHHFLP
jgi:hypothetical protein